VPISCWRPSNKSSAFRFRSVYLDAGGRRPKAMKKSANTVKVKMRTSFLSIFLKVDKGFQINQQTTTQNHHLLSRSLLVQLKKKPTTRRDVGTIYFWQKKERFDID
jgi:hypothetical protein